MGSEGLLQNCQHKVRHIDNKNPQAQEPPSHQKHLQQHAEGVLKCMCDSHPGGGISGGGTGGCLETAGGDAVEENGRYLHPQQYAFYLCHISQH